MTETSTRIITIPRGTYYEFIEQLHADERFIEQTPGGTALVMYVPDPEFPGKQVRKILVQHD